MAFELELPFIVKMETRLANNTGLLGISTRIVVPPWN